MGRKNKHRATEETQEEYFQPHYDEDTGQYYDDAGNWYTKAQDEQGAQFFVPVESTPRVLEVGQSELDGIEQKLDDVHIASTSSRQSSPEYTTSKQKGRAQDGGNPAPAIDHAEDGYTYGGNPAPVTGHADGGYTYGGDPAPVADHAEDGYTYGSYPNAGNYTTGHYSDPYQPAVASDPYYQPGQIGESSAAGAAYAPLGSSGGGLDTATITETYADNAEGETAEFEGEIYRMEPSWKFRRGEVLKTIRSEMKGAKTDAPLTNYRMDPQKHFYFGPRRFIVVNEGHGRSTCVPIYTYEHRGCKKKGVKPDEHGIVYSLPGKPQMLRDEPPLGFTSVPVIMNQGEKLAKESRALYAKLETIEHNHPVRFIGAVDPQYLDIVDEAVDICWSRNRSENKDGKHRKKHHKK